MSDPRRRKTRHVLTPENLSSTIQVTNLPADWTQDTVSSIVAGSGPIINISSKNDPRTGKLSAVLYDYKTSKDCKRALDILSRISNLPCQLERIIPPNYENHAEGKSELTLNRDSFPWKSGLDLPFEMVSEVPLPRKPVTTSATSGTSNDAKVAFPDILSKASQHLPQLQPGVLTVTDPVSENLSKTPPLQLIEIISNLKILASQDISRRSQLESFLKTSLDISVSVTQALLEMGFIDYNAVTNVIKSQAQSNGSMANNMIKNGIGSATSSNSNTPMNQNMAPLNNRPMPMPIAPPFMAQQPQMQQPPMPFGFVPPPMPFMPPAPSQHSPPPIAAPQPGSINMVKLQSLPQNQRDMIKQVLTLTDDQLRSLPVDQRTMVENLRKEYTV
ncbi:hypothetical protein HG536_0D04930 [Torulaspora globosa]|uniref:RRM domain-containing protein n=1 Tax=Torulaspora globosa TaxID=48254 RepID=A0A7G3ZHI5_9SACH|nr:uncharacterized protein HG536_0D04930 [Torulaspora globosa]QLL32971.1 hypothetical protein HG536_0D04930 [Torulaspora globosa]